ncbi:MAG: SRPBCC domain-containing protein [Actinobacteria bacterium]|nr:SRPBCC domain-containing protein [Actinomycetota bacterium]
MADDSTPHHAVRIERILGAPPSTIWQMWTTPEHFQGWYGPAGATVVVTQLDLTVGGTRLVRMEVMTPNGPMTMWFTGTHLEVVENKRLVYTESMCDESGRILAPADMGMPADHPVLTTITIDLDDHDRGTKMVIVHAGIPAESPGAAGWTMAFDKLDSYLGAQSAT